MSYRKKTLRGLPEHTRELAKLINELDSVQRRLQNLMPKFQEDEFMLKAQNSQIIFLQNKLQPQSEEELNFDNR